MGLAARHDESPRSRRPIGFQYFRWPSPIKGTALSGAAEGPGFGCCKAGIFPNSFGDDLVRCSSVDVVVSGLLWHKSYDGCETAKPPEGALGDRWRCSR
jgi:hypothetical protein